MRLKASARNSKISKRQRERHNSTLNNNALQNEKTAKRTEAVISACVRSGVDNYVQSVFQSQQSEPGVPNPSQNSLDSNVRKQRV